jgi:hypothetical protein
MPATCTLTARLVRSLRIPDLATVLPAGTEMAVSRYSSAAYLAVVKHAGRTFECLIDPRDLEIL